MQLGVSPLESRPSYSSKTAERRVDWKQHRGREHMQPCRGCLSITSEMMSSYKAEPKLHQLGVMQDL